MVMMMMMMMMMMKEPILQVTTGGLYDYENDKSTGGEEVMIIGMIRMTQTLLIATKDKNDIMIRAMMT